jgi:murein L,D-transpeptidase YafK
MRSRRAVVRSLPAVCGAICLGMPLLAVEPPDFIADAIVVHKSKRQLLLVREGKVIRRYRIGLGQSPLGHKQRQGDSKTPEGLYTISGRNPASNYHLALQISYPNDTDLERASAAGEDPGGDIMIHGLPNDEAKSDRHTRMSDWTMGCIAVTNEDIEEIWQLVPDGTPIQINP